MDKVLKTEDLLKKVDWQRKTYPLKLNLTDIQRLRIEQMAFEFKKVINGSIDIILKNIYPKFILNGTEKIKKGKCPLCKADKELKYILEDYKIQTYGKDYRRVVYKKGERIKVCNCFEGNTSPNHRIMRMFMLPTKERLIKKENDIKQFGNLGGSGIYDSALQKAMECIKSQVQIKQKLKWRIDFLRQRILDNNIKLNNPNDKEFLDFIDIKKLDKKEGIKLLRRFIKSDEKQIENLKERFAEKIEYKYDVIRLYNNTYSLMKEGGDYCINLKDFIKNKWLILEFYGKNYQKKLADKFIKSKNAETEIIRKGDNWFLQYIYRKEINVPVPDKTFTAIGIDVNLINLACLVSMNNDLKKIEVKFYSGRQMRFKRKRFKGMRKIWNAKTKYKEKGGKGRSEKWYQKKQDSQNEKKYVRYAIHKLTTNIVHYIKDTYNKPVIVMENLKNIRDRIGKELKITKCSIEKLEKKQQKAIRGEKLLNSELNNWNFDDFQKFIEYKANWLGIPVIYIPAKDTSIKCNKCSNTQEENYENYHIVKFKCKKCKYECNADFNAGINIARSFYNSYN